MGRLLTAKEFSPFQTCLFQIVHENNDTTINILFYHTPRLFLAHYCILRVILLLSAYEVNFGVNILLYQSVQVIYYLHTRSITLKNAQFCSKFCTNLMSVLLRFNFPHCARVGKLDLGSADAKSPQILPQVKSRQIYSRFKQSRSSFDYRVRHEPQLRK